MADPTGAAVPGATVVVKNVQTGLTQTQTSNSSGEYTFTTVNPGDYTVTTTAPGFKATTQTGVAVASNQNVHVTFAMVAGGTSETVEVEPVSRLWIRASRRSAKPSIRRACRNFLR